MALLVLSAIWSANLAWRLAKRNGAAGALGILVAAAFPLAAWSTQFFVCDRRRASTNQSA